MRCRWRWRRRRREAWRKAALRAAGEKGTARMHLLGPVHGTVQTIRGMCSDQLSHEEIDDKLGALDDLVYEAAAILGHGD